MEDKSKQSKIDKSIKNTDLNYWLNHVHSLIQDNSQDEPREISKLVDQKFWDLF